MRIFELKGIVCFSNDEMAKKAKKMLHYYSYIFSNNEFYLTDDLNASIQKINKFPDEQIAFIVYAEL